MYILVSIWSFVDYKHHKLSVTRACVIVSLRITPWTCLAVTHVVTDRWCAGSCERCSYQGRKNDAVESLVIVPSHGNKTARLDGVTHPHEVNWFQPVSIPLTKFICLVTKCRCVSQYYRVSEADWNNCIATISVYICGRAVNHLTMLTRHLEKQLEESRTEVETLRRRVELLSDESQRVARDKAALLHTLSCKVLYAKFSSY